MFWILIIQCLWITIIIHKSSLYIVEKPTIWATKGVDYYEQFMLKSKLTKIF